MSSTASPRRRGRPIGPEGARDKLTKTYLTGPEKVLAVEKAGNLGLTESEYLRALVRRDSGLPNKLDQQCMDFPGKPEAEEFKKAG